MIKNLFTLAALVPLLPGVLSAGPAASPAPQPEARKSFAESGSLTEYFLGSDNFLDSAYDDLQAWKKEHHLPIAIGAHHWWHVDRDEYVYGDGYGVPGSRGTYYYYLTFDPVLKLDGAGFVDELGIYVQGRIRDDSDRLRAFYANTYWTYQAYGYVKTDIGTFKAGQIVKQFGVAWDGSWWEGVPYFDGYSFDPDYGVSWENTWKASETFTITTALQFFFHEDGINGSIAGADPESIAGLNERNTGVVRIVPTWKLNDDTTLAWGISGLVGEIEGSGNFPGVDDSQVAWGTDLTLTYKNFSIWGEYIQAHGAISPSRYVSGGPSDRVNSARGGVSYKHGPITYHVNYSKGWDHDPDGDQWVFDPGVSVQLTKNLTLYAEYVRWEVTNSKGSTSKYNDGFELVLVWNL